MAMTAKQRKDLAALMGASDVDERGNIVWPDGTVSASEPKQIGPMAMELPQGTGYMRSSSGNEYQFKPEGVFQGEKQIFSKENIPPRWISPAHQRALDEYGARVGQERQLRDEQELKRRERLAKIGVDESVAAKNMRESAAPAGGAKLSTFDSKQLDRSMKASESAAGVVGLLEQARGLYGKYKSSRAEPILGGLARVGASLGMGGDRARDYEIGEQIAKDLGVIKLGLIGGSDTERELQVAIDTSPSPDKTVAANEKIIENALRAAQILQQYPDFQTEWINRYGSLSRVNEQGEPLGKAWRRYQKESFQPVSDNDETEPAAATSQEKKPNLNQKDMEALNWAMKNPNDPRAAQIKQRLGAQ